MRDRDTLGKLRQWIDAYSKIDPALLPLITVNTWAAAGIARGAKADRLILYGKVLGLDEAQIEAVAEPYLDQSPIPWDDIKWAIVARALGQPVEPRPSIASQQFRFEWTDRARRSWANSIRES